MPAFSLRPRTPSDEPFVRDLIARWKAEEMGLHELPAEAFHQVDMQIDAMDFGCPGAQSLIIENADGRPTGRAVLHPEASALRVAELILEPRSRGRGIGAAVLTRVMADAQAKGLPLRLSVMAASPARNLYRRLGMAETCRQGPMILMEA